MSRLAFLTLLFALASPLAVSAFEAEAPLPDPAQEARAQAIDEKLRCLVCQNQSIADSEADLAKDIRRLVRERVAAGDTDEAVIAYLVSRYGDFILLKPPVKATTYLLWFGPGALLIAGGLAVFLYLRRRAQSAAAEDAAPLTEAERARLDELLARGKRP